jgi:radical SAM protein with 4Fe4S-binding SPASM domain
MFSPVYESNFTDEHWKIWENECYKVIDYIAELRAQGRKAEVEHFKSYQGKDNSKWPCGAGRFYVGFDIDGAIYPCHRFNKFNDNRPWQEKEVCIGHVEVGITNPDFRKNFIDFAPECGKCPRLQDTPCHGGCYAVNFDFTGSISTPYNGICIYTDMQKKVSEYYKEKLGTTQSKSNGTCICDYSNYTGPLVPNVPLPNSMFTSEEKEILRAIIMDIDRRLRKLEEKVGK